MYFVYVLLSKKSGRHYIGSCACVEERLKRHNAGATKSTRPFRPWILIYSESFANITEARKRELQIKSYKGGEAFGRLIQK